MILGANFLLNPLHVMAITPTLKFFLKKIIQYASLLFQKNQKIILFSLTNARHLAFLQINQLTLDIGTLDI
jgi:hypothetical protein